MVLPAAHWSPAKEVLIRQQKSRHHRNAQAVQGPGLWFIWVRGGGGGGAIDRRNGWGTDEIQGLGFRVNPLPPNRSTAPTMRAKAHTATHLLHCAGTRGSRGRQREVRGGGCWVCGWGVGLVGGFVVFWVGFWMSFDDGGGWLGGCGWVLFRLRIAQLQRIAMSMRGAQWCFSKHWLVKPIAIAIAIAKASDSHVIGL